MTEQPFLPYGRQTIAEDDIDAVGNVLRSDWLTTGPMVERFEAALATEVDAKHAVACSSGTAALYLAARAAGLKSGDAVIVPAITFVATASANILAGLEVVFADVDPMSGLMTADTAAAAFSRGGRERVKAIFSVHLGGRVDDPAALHSFGNANGLVVIEDACHAFGTIYGNGHRVGGCEHSLASCFSFHPVKAIAMGEGGAVTTNSNAVAATARLLRNHGMNRDPATISDSSLARAADGTVNPWYYEVANISHNLRVSDINCALGLSQIRKAGSFIAARRSLMDRYAERLAPLSPAIQIISSPPAMKVGWHLCSILVDFAMIGINRKTFMGELHASGIGSQVHYIPVHMQPFYRARYGELHLPGAAAYYERALTLPLFSAMTEADVDRVATAIAEIVGVH